MKKLLAIIMTFVALYSASNSQNTYKITYIANEGFLVETGGKKIVIDALFNTINAKWCDSPSPKTAAAMRNATAPFNNIDIITITHKHVDHFNADIVADHLQSNKKVSVLCPEQVQEILAQDPDYSKFRERVISSTPALYQDTSLVISDVQVRIMRLEHSHYMITDSNSGKRVNKHRFIENLGYVFNVNGFKFFHCGDTNPLNEKEYATFKMQDEDLDFAFLERLFFAGDKKGQKIVNKYIQPKNIVFMHVSPGNKEVFADHFREIKNMTVFENKMDVLFSK